MIDTIKAIIDIHINTDIYIYIYIYMPCVTRCVFVCAETVTRHLPSTGRRWTACRAIECFAMPAQAMECHGTHPVGQISTDIEQILSNSD